MIYQAHDPVIDRKVAIKLVRADLLNDPDRADYLERFHREAQAAGRCAHPNIVAIYDFDVYEGNPFLAMEYVEGGDLGQALARSGRFAPADAIAVLGQVLDALSCAHSVGIVHRDVKPANILLLVDRRVKMTDFGISRIDSSALTELGSVVGTPSYMSPEQCRGDPVDARSDLFSAGVVLYEVLTGERPFAGRTLTEIVYKVANLPAPDIRAKYADLPPGLASVVQRALAKRGEDRFQSASEMADALRTAPEVADQTVVLAQPRTAVAIAEMQQAERELTRFLGPIARVLVKRAQAAAKSPDEFWRSLASHIERESDRVAFLKKKKGSHGVH
jgi:eukaryotic-like serine/threonine-protein kinase